MAKVPVDIKISALDFASGAFGAVRAQLQALSSTVSETSRRIENAQKPYQGLINVTRKMGEGLKSAGASLTAGVTAPVVALGGLAIKTAADFESAMNELSARTQAPREEMAKLSAEARRIGANTQFSASEAANAMVILGKAGMSTKDIIASTANVMGLASAEGISLEQAAEQVSDTLNAFRMKATESARAADVLAKAAGISTIGVHDIAVSMKYAAPAAARYGATLEQVSAAIAVLGNVGIKGEVAGTAIRSLFSDITSNKKTIGILQKAGVQGRDLFTDASMKQLKSLPELLKAIGGANLSDIQFAEAFGKEFTGPIKMLISNLAEVKKATEDLGNSTGFAASIGAERMKGFNGAVKNLKSAFEELLIGSTEKETTGLLDTATKLVEKLKEWVDAFNALDPATKKTIFALAGVAAAVGPVLFVLGSMATSISSIIALCTTIGPVFGGVVTALATMAAGITSTALVAFASLKAALITAATATKAFTLAVLANPLTWWAVGIAAVIAAAVLLYQNWDTVVAKLTPAFTAIRAGWTATAEAFREGFESVKAWGLGLWDSIAARWAAGIDAIKGKFNGLVGMIPESIRSRLGIDLMPTGTPAAEGGQAPKGTLGVPTPELGAPLGTGNVSRSLSETKTMKQENALTVTFENTPKGTRVTPAPKNTTPLNLNLGYAMQGP